MLFSALHPPTALIVVMRWFVVASSYLHTKRFDLYKCCGLQTAHNCKAEHVVFLLGSAYLLLPSIVVFGVAPANAISQLFRACQSILARIGSS